MKICLHIDYGISSFRFEHASERLTVGRGPENTIPFPGDPGRNLGWTHASVELTPQGAFLSDEGSETGTYLNDRRIDERTRVVVGDRINLSADGPLLHVEMLELPTQARVPTAAPSGNEGWWQGHPPGTPGAPPPILPSRSADAQFPCVPPISAPLPRSLIRHILVILAAVAAIGGMAAVLIGMRLGRGSVERPTPPEPSHDETANQTPHHPPNNSPPVATPVQTPVATPVQTPVATPVHTPVETLPRLERTSIGTYVRAPSAPPSILVEKRHDAQRWGQIQPNQRVHTSSHLVSLPGCRSRIQLDRGVNLELWGNVPEFSSFPPVLDSAVMLHEPPADFDLDFTLERGRVHLSSLKPEGPARIRVRFHRETWDVTLPDTKSAVVLEQWGVSPPGIPREPGERVPEQNLGLLVRGGAGLRLSERSIALVDKARFTWTSGGGAAAAPEVLPRLPVWWTDRITPDDERRADMMLALQDYDQRFSKTDAVLDAVSTEVRESALSANRILGVLFLAAIDAGAALIDCLEDRNHPEVRGTGAFCLRQWIARGRDQEVALFSTLHDGKGYSREKSTTILQLLHNFTPEDRSDPRTFDRLIGYLNHENLSVRDLAFWHLVLLAPEVARQVPYRPTDAPDQRAQAIEKWRKFVPPGSVPPVDRKP